jgi:hypothetical protein
MTMIPCSKSCVRAIALTPSFESGRREFDEMKKHLRALGEERHGKRTLGGRPGSDKSPMHAFL